MSLRRAGPVFSRARLLGDLPSFVPGMRIGLFGGSFNPPHGGHALVSMTAWRRLQLDQIWWLVTPGNPLKDRRALADLPQRIQAIRRLTRHPAIRITAIEATIGARYSFDTIRFLRQRCPGVRFVWLMGADNMASFHHWQHWRDIADLAPICVVDRPGMTHLAVAGRATSALARYRCREADARHFADLTAPALLFLHGPRSNQSSSALRQLHKWP